MRTLQLVGKLVALLVLAGASSAGARSPAAAPAHAASGPSAAAAAAAAPGEQSYNLVDVLAHSADHTIFVRLLQRARLIPTLNNLMQFGDPDRGLSILAPTNAAFLSSPESKYWLRLAHLADDKADSEEGRSERSDGPGLNSNSDEVLRQRLLYHVLNFTLPFSNASSDSLPFKPILFPTLHFPSRHLFDPSKPDKPTRPGPIPHPPAPPFMPGFDPDALLGTQGQVLRISAFNVTKSDTDPKVGKPGSPNVVLTFGSDHQGRGGVVAVAEDWSSRHGVVVSVNGVLRLPPKLEDIIHSHPSLASLSTLFPPNTLRSLSLTPHLTLFAPASAALESNLSRVEHSYLFSPRWEKAKGDRFKLLGWHSVSQGVDGREKEGVIYADDLRSKGRSTLLTILGGRIETVADPATGALSVGPAQVLEENIIIENGVIHIVSDLLLPYPQLGLGLTVEKTLLGLNASKFVSLVRETELDDYLTHPVAPFDRIDGAEPSGDSPALTFVVPRDDFIEEGVLRSSLPKDKKKLRDVLRYHIAPGKLVPQSLSNGMLVGTELRDWRLKDGRQRVTVSVGDEDATLRKGNGDVAFGGVNVISDPVQVGPSLIYLTSAFLTPPANPIQTAVSSLELSTFVAAVFSAHLDTGLKRAPGITYLVPSNAAFENLGLVMPYLLSGTKTDGAERFRYALGAEADRLQTAFLGDGTTLRALEGDSPVTPRDELRSVVEFHAIDSIVYLQDFPEPPKTNRSSGRGDGLPISWTRYPTLLDGSHIWAGRDANGTVRIRRTDPPTPAAEQSRVNKFTISGPLLGPDDQNDAVLKKADMLTSTGVIHEISRVELPETLDITIGKLMLGAKADTMIEIVRKAGYGWILNGSTPAMSQADDLFTLDDILDAQKSGNPNKRRKKERKRHKRRHDMFRDEKQAYILLCPTDEAFAKFNLTRYVEDKQALKRLVQLHILPLTPDAAQKVAQMNEAAYGGLLLPLALDDRLAFTSLLDKQLGGTSAYGSVAFRRAASPVLKVHTAALGGTPERGRRPPGNGGRGGGGDDDANLGWMVGIRGTRGSVNGKKHVANVVGFGRENLGVVRRSRLGVAGNGSGDGGGGGGDDVLPYPSMRVAGGVLTIDAVLEEYHPSWWYIWGWIVALCLLMAGVFGLIGFGIWRFRTRDGKIRLPDALEGEED
ncbi:hypothetical protein OC844_002975 [Tilletia horrida]|nr:hypothetical protein OC844_002975 [Tilletia horrida]